MWKKGEGFENLRTFIPLALPTKLRLPASFTKNLLAQLIIKKMDQLSNRCPIVNKSSCADKNAQ